ncbi:hypothetical protein ACHAWF_001046, partial [Thalassiosira exigua]
VEECDVLLGDALVDKAKFSLTRHKECVRDAAKGFWQVKIEKEFRVWTGIGARRVTKVMKQLERKEDTGALLTCVPTRFDGNCLSRKEWKDHVAVRYGRRPKGLPARCDGCRAGFTVEHGLNCKCGGLIGIRHDDQCREWVHLNKLCHSNASVRTEPQIFYGSNVEGGNQEGRDGDLGGESRGDVSVHGFWKRGRTTIFDF